MAVALRTFLLLPDSHGSSKESLLERLNFGKGVNEFSPNSGKVSRLFKVFLEAVLLVSEAFCFSDNGFSKLPATQAGLAWNSLEELALFDRFPVAERGLFLPESSLLLESNGGSVVESRRDLVVFHGWLDIWPVCL